MNLDSIQYKPNPAEDFPSWSGKPLARTLNSADTYPSLWNTDFKELSLSDEPSMNSLAVPARSQKGAHMNDRVNRDHCQSPREGQGCVDAALLDPNELQMQVDFFRKLGYSPDEIRAVLQKLGLNADTNTVLGELVRSGATASEREMVPTNPPGPTVVSQGENSPTMPGTPPPPQEDERDEGSLLRPVVIDGSNVAMSHGNKEVFSCRGILLAVNCFLDRGHTDITVFVPSWRKEQPRPDVPITDQHILRELEKKKIMVFTPSRRVGGKRVVCYDDRFIVKLACESDGIIVSNDTYRDLQSERQEWKRFIEERLLMYSFVNDKFMPPDDPLGRHGPSLDNFLRKKPLVQEQKRQHCPYGKKCTYGIKCKFYHPERINQSQRSVADELRANAKLSTTRAMSHSSPLKDEKQPILSRKSSQPDMLSMASLEQEMEQKLMLERRNALQKGHITENSLLVKGATLSKRPSKKVAFNQCSHHSPTKIDSFPCPSQEPLDSGLGSYESQYSEMMPRGPQGHCEHYHPEQRGSGRYSNCSKSRPVYQHSQSLDQHDSYQQYNCSQKAMTAGASFHQYNPELPNSRSSNVMGHGGHCYPGYGRPVYQGVMGPYSLPDDYHPGSVHPQREYWSDPFQVAAHGRSSSLQDHQRFQQHLPSAMYNDQQSHQWPQQDPYTKEREDVRKKLLAIFNPHQVDKAMSMFPNLFDPQSLAAEILTLKSRGELM